MFGNVLKSSDLLYSVFDMYRAGLQPLNCAAHQNSAWLRAAKQATPSAASPLTRLWAAGAELTERLTRRYGRPEFGYASVTINDVAYPIHETVVSNDPFCQLVHFRSDGAPKRPRLLVLPPLSGHYPTLVRGTIDALLPHADIYAASWINARDVPLSAGTFGFDDFVHYCMRYMNALGPDLHVLAVCQPSVPALAACALLSEEGAGTPPLSMTLMGGPVDARVNHTQVSALASKRSMQWFKDNVITRVPLYYPGGGREVYPGFLQLSGFISMNLNAHVNAHLDLFRHIAEGNCESAESVCAFYDEYLSVMDMPAEFYLETVQKVFRDFSLPEGTLKVAGRLVRPEIITRTSVLCIEGERDDISAPGQTLAALKLCPALPEARKQYYLQKGAGHYGIFNGRKYREQVAPLIAAFMRHEEAAYGSHAHGDGVLPFSADDAAKTATPCPANDPYEQAPDLLPGFDALEGGETLAPQEFPDESDDESEEPDAAADVDTLDEGADAGDAQAPQTHDEEEAGASAEQQPPAPGGASPVSVRKGPRKSKRR